MNRRRRCPILALLATACLPLITVTHARGWAEVVIRYTIADLGHLGGGRTIPYSINNAGQVVGESSTASGAVHAFLFTNGSIRDLNTLGGANSCATAINVAGQIVGWSDRPGDLTRHAFIHKSGPLQDLGPINGPHSAAYAVNATGQVVGTWGVPGSPFQRGFRHDGSQAHPLGALGGQGSIARGINTAGQVVGLTSTPGGDWHAFRTSPYNPINRLTDDLGTLGGWGSWANAINDSGQVVGASWIRDNTAHHAFLYSNGAMQDLHVLGAMGGRWSEAHAISASGIVVGWVAYPDGSQRAFVSGPAGPQDLTSLLPSNSGWVLQAALSVNDDGQIVGFGTLNGQPRGFVLTPESRPFFGHTHPGAIETTRPETPHPFRVSKSGWVLLRMATESGDLWPKLTLYPPGGGPPLEDRYKPTCVEVFRFLSEGEYAVVASDGFNGTYTGRYRLFAQNTTSPENARRLNSGETVVGPDVRIEHAAEMDTYVFTATAGQRVRLTMATEDALWPSIRLHLPSGELYKEVYGPTSVTLDERLPRDGTYTVLVGDGFNCTYTGRYTLSFLKF